MTKPHANNRSMEEKPEEGEVFMFPKRNGKVISVRANSRADAEAKLEAIEKEV